MATNAIIAASVSQRLACKTYGISLRCLRCKPVYSAENEVIADWLIRITETHKRWGFCLCFDYLRNVQGFVWNHKRVYRIYCLLALNLRIKPKRRIKRDKPEALAVPEQINMYWSMDFMSDTLADGRSIRSFNVIDDYNRESLCIDVDFSMPSKRVIQSLERIIEWRGKPKAIRCDNGPEYISDMLADWAETQDITLNFIQPGKPTQNAYIERFNRTARQEWLELYLFESIEQAQYLATQWQWVYNNERPHSAIGRVPPRYLLKKAA